MSDQDSIEIVKVDIPKTPKPLLPYAFVFALLTIPLVVIGLFARVYKYSTAFSYSPIGDLTPSNTSTLETFAARNGVSKLDDVERPSRSCSDAFSSLTCNLWITSAVFNLVGGLAAIATAALFIRLVKTKQPKKSKVWGSYLLSSASSFLALSIALICTLTAAFRVLNTELNSGIAKSVSDGVLAVVQSTVASEIQNNTDKLQQASLLLQWSPISTQLANFSSPLFNKTLSAACNYSTTVVATDIPSLQDTTQKYIICLTNKTSSQQVQQYNTTGYALFHNASLVAAFNIATKLTLPLTTPPSALDDLIVAKAYATGNSTFMTIEKSLYQSLENNTKISYDIGFYCLVAGVFVSLLTVIAAAVDFSRRDGELKRYEDEVKTVI